MLLDCSKLQHWNWDRQIEELFTLKRDYQKWMTLQYEDPGTIGELEEEWNHFDTLNEKTKLIHMTSRITQPWKTGLPIDFSYSDLKRKKSAMRSGASLLRRVFAGVLNKDIYNNLPEKGFYQPHPDKKQEEFFFGLLKECLDKKLINEEMLRIEIECGNVREDLFKIISNFGEPQKLE
jgi:hypothetical protein